jgi:hypothetical protein
VPAINSENVEFWRDVAKEADKQRPRTGRRVCVVGGRKHKGKEGLVTRHQHDQFSHAYRYGNEASMHMKDMVGRSGWVCLVQPDDGSQPFWVKADFVECINVTKE